MLQTVNNGISQDLYEVSSAFLLPLMLLVLALFLFVLLMCSAACYARPSIAARCGLRCDKRWNCFRAPEPLPLAAWHAIGKAPSGVLLPRLHAQFSAFARRRYPDVPAGRRGNRSDPAVSRAIGVSDTRVGPMLGLLGTLIPFGTGPGRSVVRAMFRNCRPIWLRRLRHFDGRRPAVRLAGIRHQPGARGWYTRDCDELRMHIARLLSECLENGPAQDQEMGRDGSEDPTARLGQLYLDIWMVFAVALLLAFVQAGLLRANNSDAASAEHATETVQFDAVKVRQLRLTEDRLTGQGRRLGTAYRLQSGEVVYVPDQRSPTPPLPRCRQSSWVRGDATNEWHQIAARQSWGKSFIFRLPLSAFRFPHRHLSLPLFMSILTPDDPALDDLWSKLFAGADAPFQAETQWPAEALRLCGEAGVFRWFLPRQWGGFDWSDQDLMRGYLRLSAASLTVAFVITQRIQCLPLAGGWRFGCGARQKWLPSLATGEKFTTVGISHLTTSRRHLARPLLAVEETPDGFVLDGFSPWVTGARLMPTLIVSGGVLPKAVSRFCWPCRPICLASLCARRRLSIC